MSHVEENASFDPATRVQELLAIYGDANASVARLLCDRHPADARAYTLVESNLNTRALTYGELKESSERFAAALAGLGVFPGDRVATLLGKSVDQLIAVMGIWRLGAVHVPLFTAFATPAIAFRLLRSRAKVVICDTAQRPKLFPGEDISAVPPWRVIVVGEPAESTDLRFAELIARQEPGFPAAALGGQAPILQTYTSGTTGRPKGVVVPTLVLASVHAYMEFGLDVRSDDVFWNAADPGWAYGHYYGILGPFLLGVPNLWLQGRFTADVTWAVLSQQRVTNFTAAPTVYRSLRALHPKPSSNLFLRCASAAGEPLTPEINEWAREALGVIVHDHYGQTETGMLINNHQHPAVRRPLKTGSMGHAMPGWRVVVLEPDRDVTAAPGTQGRIAVDLQASPLAWFSGYVDESEISAETSRASERWYPTGDVGSMDPEGYFSFLSRADDVIIMAGYRIGPFEVESVLLTHPAVLEAAVIAVPDPIRGEVLEACVVLWPDHAGTSALAAELQQWVKERYAAHAYPRAVHFVSELPKTPSGKVQRFMLRDRGSVKVKR